MTLRPDLLDELLDGATTRRASAAAVHDELAVWPSRPHQATCPALELDARITEVRARGVVSNKAASVAVELHTPARVKGDIATPSLMVERGVHFQGASKMPDQTASNVVRFANTADGASD